MCERLRVEVRDEACPYPLSRLLHPASEEVWTGEEGEGGEGEG